MKYFGTLFKVSVAMQDDLSEMMSVLSQEKPPTIVLKGVPYEWFADHHSMENLRALFHTFGRLRNLDIDDNNVSIQFEDPEECSKALKKLCSCSLKKINDSRMVDYNLTLKDLPDSSIAQLMLTTDNYPSLEKDDSMPVSKETFKGQDMHALMVRMTEIEKELKYLKAKIESSSAC
ncbi:uncharacterized protein LOC110714952 [Chenopodium quinoa]|uniref:uncharacterized protein LOC110714952 n=1 Tax=Chenopodium quinoa TaxID=63459 RepID=UPI000B788376|nr:uncharacterized protein LOC110714952 [Chenopodium quinoa]